MAHLADSRWLTAQYKVSEVAQRPEMKKKTPAAIQATLLGNPILVPASERERVWNVKTSDQHVTEINILKKVSVVEGTKRVYNHTGTKGDSKKAALTWNTYTAGVATSLKQMDRNIFTAAESEAMDILSCINNIHDRIETGVIAALNLNKSQVVQDLNPKGLTWDPVAFMASISQDDKKVAFQRLKSFMRQQYYRGALDFVHDEGFYQMLEWVVNQGAGNSENLAWQLQNVSGFASTEINDAGYEASGYAFERGSIALMTWIPEINRRGTGDTFANGGMYSTIKDPYGLPFEYAVHRYAAGVDNDSTTAESQDVDIFTEVSLDWSFVMPPVGVANETPIYKVGVLGL